MGLAFAQTGWLYPLFGPLIGWLGVALTGSDTSSTVLFGGLQRVSAEQLHINPILMAAANSSGGVMALPSLYWLACWCARKRKLASVAAHPTMNSRERVAGDICNAADHLLH